MIARARAAAFWGAALALAALVGCSGARTPLVVAKDRVLWRRVESRHFVIESNHPDVERLTRLALAFETFLSGLGALAILGRRLPTSKTLVVALDDPDEYRWFLRDHTGGFFHRRSPLGPMVVMPMSRRFWRSDVLKHELSHLIVAQFMPQAPDWLDEGLACTVETARYDEGDGRIVFGAPDAGRLQAAIGVNRVSLFTLISRWPDDAGVELYSASWLLVRYLIDRHREAFLAFERKVSRGQPWTRAWNEEIPLALEAMTAPLDEYRRRGQFRRWTVRVDRPSSAPVATVPSAADVYALIAALYVTRSGDERPAPARYEVAGRRLEDALALDPSNRRAARVVRYLDRNAKGGWR